MKINIKLLIFGVVIVVVRCRSVTDNSAGTAGNKIDGKALIKMGRQFNKPMLTAIGMAISNLHRCSQWSQWSDCGATKTNYFGTRNRTRECRLEMVDKFERSKTETDFSICEGGSDIKSQVICPTDYKMTTNGFCMKLYETKKNHDDAETVCQNDGGFLINIDSSLKYGDVKSILEGVSFMDINIGGRRQNSGSPWEYKYGTNSGHFKWYDSYPRSDNALLCLALERKTSSNLENYLWWNLSCSTRYPFLCEIPLNT